MHGVMVCVFVSGTVDRGFEPWLGQTRDYQFGIRCFPAKHLVLRNSPLLNKDWLAQNQGNVIE
jgi:hypothetical protein